MKTVNKMNFRHLKYFIATAESGQVSRAALDLNISQSSITSAIKELEHTLGSTLFTRNAQGMELTDAGREFLSSSYEILQKIDDAMRLTRQSAHQTGTIGIAASYTVMGYFLPYHLERLGRRYPGLDVRMEELNRESIEEGLLSSRLDIAVILTSNISNPEIETETLLRSPRRLWLSNGHHLANTRRVNFADIAQEPYIMLTVDEAAHTTMGYWSKTPFRPKVRLRTSSVEAVRSMVANGAGVTILSDMVYRPWSLEGRRIVTTATDIPVPSMDIGLAWRRGATFSPAMDIFTRYFRQVFLTPQNQAMHQAILSTG